MTTPNRLSHLDLEAAVFTPGMPMASLTKSGLVTPSRPARISSKSIVTNLLSAKVGEMAPFTIVTLSFVVRCFGPAHDEHLEVSREHDRLILRQDSALRLKGGLPQEFVSWLCAEDGYHGGNLDHLCGNPLCAPVRP
jgi:hypothetical protein